MDAKQLAQYEDRELEYHDYVRIINAKSGHWDHRKRNQSARFVPSGFEKKTFCSFTSRTSSDAECKSMEVHGGPWKSVEIHGTPKIHGNP